MIRRLLLLLLLALTPTAHAAAETALKEDDIRFTIELEAREHRPLVGEMIILTIRGVYRPHITLEEVVQPDFDGFDWMQLGADRWWRTQERGLPVLNLERRMALFPQRAGMIAIEPVHHKLTLLTPGGRRFEHEAVSNALSLAVDPAPAEAEAGWWLPVRSIRIGDEWSNPPEQLEPGAGALRVVRLTVEGVKPEAIPPMPEMTGAGALIFPHPEKRLVTLGPNGPRTQVFWRWTIRPGASSAGFVDPLEITYFDTGAREMRTVALAAQRVAYRGAGGAAAPPPRRSAEAAAPEAEAAAAFRIPPFVFAAITPAALALGAIAGIVLLRGAFRERGAAPRACDEDARRVRALRRALRRAARAGDARAVWRIGAALIAGDPAPAPLAALEAALFGPGDARRPDLKTVARAVLSARPARPLPGGAGSS